MSRLAPSQSLPVDVSAREIFGCAAIAVGMGDTDAALDVCRNLLEIEQHYHLVLKTGDDAPRAAAPAKAVRLASRYAGTCRACRKPHAVGDAVWWTAGVQGVLCPACGGGA